MILNEIKCHVNTSLGLVGGCIPCIAPLCPRLAIVCYYFCSGAGEVAPLLHSENSESGSAAIFKVAVAHF